MKLVTCKRCGKLSECTFGKTPFPAIQYIGYDDEEENFYLCFDCSKEWLDKREYSKEELKKFVEKYKRKPQKCK